MDWWRSNAPRMKSDLTSLIISCTAPRARAVHEKNRMSKAALVRGAFAIQHRNPGSQSFLQSFWRAPDSQPFTVILCRSTLLTALISSDHFSAWAGLTGTGERSDLAIKTLNELRCRRSIHRSKRLALRFPSIYGSAGGGEIFSIHPSVEGERTVLYE